MSPVFAILLTVLLLALNALFVAAEFALISARRTQLEPRVQAGSRTARMALRAIESLTLVIAAAQLGITICSLGLGAVGEPAIAHLLEPAFEAASVPEGIVHTVSFVIAMTIVVFAHVVLGEMVPKNLALVGPDRAALFLGPFMLAVVAVLKPFVVLLNGTADIMVRLFRIEPQPRSPRRTRMTRWPAWSRNPDARDCSMRMSTTWCRVRSTSMRARSTRCCCRVPGW